MNIGVPSTEFLMDQLTVLALDKPTAEVAIVGGGAALLAAAFNAAGDDVPPWRLAPESGGPDAAVVVGRGAPDNFTSTGGLNIATGAGWLTDQPSTTPTSAQPEGWSFESEFVSRHADDDLRPIDAALAGFRRRRGQRWQRLRLQCAAAGVDASVWLASYEGLFGPEWPATGKPTTLRVRLSFVSARAHEFSAASLRPRETSWRVLNPGDTFESVAGEHYGRPELGVLLRRINPDVLLESPGVRLKLLDADHPKMRASLDPLAPCFAESFVSTVNAIARDRATRSAGRSWSALSSVREPDAAEPLLYPAE